MSGGADNLIPGDLVRELRPGAFADRTTRCGRQFEEYMYGEPCSRCKRLISQVALDGCDLDLCPAPANGLVEQVRQAHAAGLAAIEEARASLEDPTVRLRTQELYSSIEVSDDDSAVDRFMEQSPVDLPAVPIEREESALAHSTDPGGSIGPDMQATERIFAQLREISDRLDRLEARLGE